MSKRTRIFLETEIQFLEQYMSKIKMEELNIEDAPNHHHSESDEEEPPMKETELEDPPTPDPMRRVKKQQEYVACPQCKKSMLLKTFKYYHSYKCRPEAPQPTLVKKQAAPEKIEVSFNEGFSRKDQRNDSIKRLISRAV